MSTTGGEKQRYDLAKWRYENCTLIDGNLELVALHRDITFTRVRMYCNFFHYCEGSNFMIKVLPAHCLLFLFVLFCQLMRRWLANPKRCLNI